MSATHIPLAVRRLVRERARECCEYFFNDPDRILERELLVATGSIREPIHFDESLAGKHGRCKRCGHEMMIPTAGQPAIAPAGGFRLEPLDPAEAEPPRQVAATSTAKPAKPLKLSPVQREPEPAGIPEELLADRVPIPLDKNFEPAPLSVPPQTSPTVITIKAGLRHSIQTVIKKLSWVGEWVYVASIFFLMISVTGMLFEYRPLGYAGAVGVIVSSVILLALGGFEVFVKPFKESLLPGLAALFLFPPLYLIYYVATRWKAMKRPFRHAVGAFVPLFVLILSFLFIRPIRNYFLHPPPKKTDGLATTAMAPLDWPPLPRIVTRS